MMWANVKEQLCGRGHRLSEISTTKMREIKASNRTLIFQKLSSELAEVGLIVGSQKLHSYARIMEVAGVQQIVTPSLFSFTRTGRTPFSTGSAAIARRMKPCFNTIHVDDAWFYPTRDKEKVWMFPGDETVAFTKVQHKTHIPKVVFMCAVSRPGPSREFDSKIGIWRVCHMKEEERTKARHQKWGWSTRRARVDFTVDSVKLGA